VQALPHLLRDAFDGVAVRPGAGGHPRLFIWGLIEARLQRADLMILGGLNEGTWPALPAPDPWLAPKIRMELGMPGIERRIGLSAHDLASALGAPQVLLTRARRDARAPTIASRFWLRIETLTGGLPLPAPRFDLLARAVDHVNALPDRAKRPRPCPPVADRPHSLSVTEVDRLSADPFAFYARAMLGLARLDPLDAEPTPAWRGTIIHDVLETWAKQDHYAPDALIRRMEHALDSPAIHTLTRLLALPRLIQAAEWIEAQVAHGREEGREPVLAEERGEVKFAGITISGKADRIDRFADGSLAIVDYKTGSPPSTKQVANGYALQLALLSLIAEGGGFTGLRGTGSAFEYWSLARDKNRNFGKIVSPCTGRSEDRIPADEFVARASAQFRTAIETWLTGNEPFTAKLRPEYAWGDYDHLMRLEEWEGRGG
jgi:ATP-dependent helicase/nuclease subunit B